LSAADFASVLCGAYAATQHIRVRNGKRVDWRRTPDGASQHSYGVPKILENPFESVLL
jgi:hypothetical protein